MRIYALALLVFPLGLLAYCNDSGGGGQPDAAVESGPAAPYSLTLLDNAHIGSDSSKPDFHVATATGVQLTGGPFASVNLVVDLTSPCFPFSNWTTDPPPAGQNWPTDCDAFDRNFEMALVDPAADTTAPGLELVRAITPFGGPEHVEQDVTDAFNAITGVRTFVVTIPSYSDGAGKVSGSNGGWFVSAHLDVTPGAAPRNVLSVTSLVYGDVPASQSGITTTIPFTLPPNTTSTTIEYRVTGHGGVSVTDPDCIGPADEFCKRKHLLDIDGQALLSPTPWRQDCSKLCTLSDASSPFNQPFCLQNPCGDQNSVRASRANWCPGSETPPIVYNPTLAPGDHTFAFSIAPIAGQWRVSTTVYAYGD